MSVYLKKFGTNNEYEAYINGGGIDLPNVSLVEESMSVGYKPYIKPILILKYNITDTWDPTKLINNIATFKSMEIDGIMLDELVTSYEFDTEGEHIVKYELDDTKLSDYAFKNCYSLTSITISNGVSSIGIGAFEGCIGLTNITIGKGVTSIGSGAFYGCRSLIGITVDSNNNIYDSRNNCNAIIDTKTNSLIRGCKTTIIPDNVTSISSSAFSRSNLINITIPDSITNIGGNAFEDCSGITSIIIPNSVTNIGYYAFGGCTGLTSIVSNAKTAPTIQYNTFQNVQTGGTLTVQSGSTGYDIWMGTGNYYLGRYSWTKVEQ